MTRYFFAQDQSSHWYIIPDDKRAEWNTWCDIPEDDERSWEAPTFAAPLNGGVGLMTFTDPQRTE